MNRPRQIPGHLYTFVKRATGEKDTGFLPRRLGENNSFAYWHKYTKGNRPGCWLSRKFVLRKNSDQAKGIGPSGLLGRMKRLIKSARANARRGGYEPLVTTPQRLLDEWNNQKGLCSACLLPLELLKAHYDHEHATGEGRGFIHPSCNLVEGILRKLPKKNRENLLKWVHDVLWWETLGAS